MLNCAHEIQERRAALRAEVEANRQRALSIQDRVPNARAVDGYSWLVFEGSEVFLESLDGHRKRLSLDVYGHIINTNDYFSEDRVAQLQAVIGAYSAEN